MGMGVTSLEAGDATTLWPRVWGPTQEPGLQPHPLAAQPWEARELAASGVTWDGGSSLAEWWRRGGCHLCPSRPGQPMPASVSLRPLGLFLLSVCLSLWPPQPPSLSLFLSQYLPGSPAFSQPCTIGPSLLATPPPLPPPWGPLPHPPPPPTPHIPASPLPTLQSLPGASCCLGCPGQTGEWAPAWSELGEQAGVQEGPPNPSGMWV
ncbi:IQ motif and SEC7 domain-containing protein 2-like, partial [Daubentonia madagascariensis]